MQPAPDTRRRPVTGRMVLDLEAPTTPHGYPRKALAGRPFDVSAVVFRDGHGERGARVRWRREGERGWRVAPMVAGHNDRYAAEVTFEDPGLHEVVVEGWTRRYATWQRDLERWLSVGEDVDAE